MSSDFIEHSKTWYLFPAPLTCCFSLCSNPGQLQPLRRVSSTLTVWALHCTLCGHFNTEQCHRHESHISFSHFSGRLFNESFSAFLETSSAPPRVEAARAPPSAWLANRGEFFWEDISSPLMVSSISVTDMPPARLPEVISRLVPGEMPLFDGLLCASLFLEEAPGVCPCPIK